MTPFWRGLKNIWSDPKNTGRSKKLQALGMTKGRMALRFSVVVGEENQIFAEQAGRSLRICYQRQLCFQNHGELQAEGKNVE
jgi:hypothetical protein